jgi:hypothetical protein
VGLGEKDILLRVWPARAPTFAHKENVVLRDYIHTLARRKMKQYTVNATKFCDSGSFILQRLGMWKCNFKLPLALSRTTLLADVFTLIKCFQLSETIIMTFLLLDASVGSSTEYRS